MALDGGLDPRSDIFNRLLKNRVVMLGSEVDDAAANQICAQLLFLEGEDPKSDVWLYVNSPGGSITAGGRSSTIPVRPRCEPTITSPCRK